MQASENLLKINSTRQGVNAFRNASFVIVFNEKGTFIYCKFLFGGFQPSGRGLG